MITCNKCTGKCCRYVSVGIPDPKTPEDWDEIRWFVMHEHVIVYKDTDGEWIVEFQTPCKHLKEDNSCGIYENRPHVCREYKLVECEMNTEGDFFQILFEKEEDVLAYMKKNNIPILGNDIIHIRKHHHHQMHSSQENK